MLRQLRRIAVAAVGGIVVAVGLAMLVLPGPAIVVIPAGLAILATEFQWARRLLHRIREGIGRGVSLFRRRRPPRISPSQPAGPAADASRSSQFRAP